MDAASNGLEHVRPEPMAHGNGAPAVQCQRMRERDKTRRAVLPRGLRTTGREHKFNIVLFAMHGRGAEPLLAHATQKDSTRNFRGRPENETA